jgi:hypothetical protein
VEITTVQTEVNDVNFPQTYVTRVDGQAVPVSTLRELKISDIMGAQAMCDVRADLVSAWVEVRRLTQDFHYRIVPPT